MLSGNSIWNSTDIQSMSFSEKETKAFNALHVKFNEAENNFFWTINATAGDLEIVTDITIPVIAIRNLPVNEEGNLQENNDNRYNYVIIFEKQIINKCNSLRKAFQLFMATYFTFNRTYPKVHGNLLLVTETYFFNITSREETCRSRNQQFKNKVISFCNALQKLNVE